MSLVPNLDAMTQVDLVAFAVAHKGRSGARLLFPKGGRGTAVATTDLVNYAWNKATAMACRLRGDISNALLYEGICERIYAGLPKFARW
jgi:hypothetical protein